MSTKKSDPTPSERDAARIAALEREVAGWMDAAERFQRECDTSDAVLVEIEALLPPPEGDDQGIVSRVRRVVVEGATARTHLDVTRQMLADVEAALPPRAPHESGLVQRVRGIVSQRDEFRQWAHDAHKVLTDARIPYGALPERARRVMEERDTAREDAASALVEMEGAAGIGSGLNLGVGARITRAREAIDAQRDTLGELALEVGLPACAKTGVIATRALEWVRSVKLNSAATAPQAGTLSPRDRAILAPLLDTLDADLSSTDAGRALAAVRAVVGVARG